jgi:chromosome segregation ATPase
VTISRLTLAGWFYLHAWRDGAQEGKPMTEPAVTPETPNVAETVNFLRRFADLMSTGHNATYLLHAAGLLETLAARATAASDEEQLWRYKYETVVQHTDALEAECEGLKQDVEGHVDITSSILAERDALKTALQARETELAELRTTLDREREALKTTEEARGGELDQIRAAFEREREELTTKCTTLEAELSELRLGFDRERDELRSHLKVREDELAAIRVVYERECEELRAKVAGLEAKRSELRAAFNRISDFRNRTVERQDDAESSNPDHGREASPQPGGDDVHGESSAIVPRAVLHQARAQFEYLARECIRRGDIASQVMCELGAQTVHRALIAGAEADHLPVGEVALGILASSGPSSAVVAETM